MKFAYTILFVPDVKAATKFYEQCFGLRTKFNDDDGDYAELDTDGVALAFASETLANKNTAENFAPSRPGSKAPAMEVAFITDNVQAAFDIAVDGGAQPVSNPEQKPWGQTVSYVRDLNGFLVEIASPINS
jgi:lactoylglutathione lyase